MANKNTIKAQLSGTIQNTLASLTNSFAGTSQTAFQLNPGLVTGSGGGIVPLSIGNPGLYFGTGAQLRIRANGTVVTAYNSTITLTLALLQVPASVISAGLTKQSFTNMNTLKTSTARSIINGTNSFAVDSTIQLSGTGVLQGQAGFIISDLLDGQAAITAATGLTGEADLNFLLTATVSASDSSTIVTLNEFSLEAV